MIIFIARCFFLVGDSFAITIRCTISENFHWFGTTQVRDLRRYIFKIELIIIFYDFKAICFQFFKCSRISLNTRVLNNRPPFNAKSLYTFSEKSLISLHHYQGFYYYEIIINNEKIIAVGNNKIWIAILLFISISNLKIKAYTFVLNFLY